MPEDVKPQKPTAAASSPAPTPEAAPVTAAPAAGKADKKKSSTVKIVLIVVGVLVGLSLLGTILAVVFFKSLFNEVNKNADINNDGSITVQSDDGSSKTTVGENVDLAQGFPSDVPIYEPSTLMASSKTDQTDFSAVAKTAKSVADVTGYYRTTMAAQGWTIQLDSESTDSSLLTFQKADRTASVVVTMSSDETSNEKTGFVVTVTTQPAQ